MDESDAESDLEEDEDIENPEPKEEESDVDLLIAPNDLVITGSADATAKVWSVYSGECIHVSINIVIVFLLEILIVDFVDGPQNIWSKICPS